MILASFATIVGVLANGQVRNLFVESMSTGFQTLQQQVQPTDVKASTQTSCADLTALAIEDTAQIRLIGINGDVLCSSSVTPRGAAVNQPRVSPPALAPATLTGTQTYQQGPNEVMAKWIAWGAESHGWLIYARPLSQIDQTVSRIRVFLGLGVIGGAILALLAGLYVAQRAMRPIAELTDAAREVERTRDPTWRIPRFEARDEVAELALTLEGMLASLAAARADTEAALDRQREFVADASHELRTPLTSVLANLELLADELDGEQADSAKSALRSTRRMRRLVGDLLLLARADAKREAPHRLTDLSEVLRDAAGELTAVSERHELILAPAPALIEANRDEMHRLILNLLENALRHTPAGTAIRASTGVQAGEAVLEIEDDGPGIPSELRTRVFERFVRGHGDTGSGTGLGLAIVRAVAASHDATVSLGATYPSPDGAEPGRGTRFEIRFPLSPSLEREATSAPLVPAPQTSTTTGRTMGRRLRRS